MNEKNKRLLLSGISGAIGGGLGAVSGSNSWIVVSIVSAFFAILVVFGLNNVFR